MTRLDDAGIHSIVWKEEEDGTVYADGCQYYEIDNNNELAIFQGEKCVRVMECVSLEHAVGIAEASEHVCRHNIRNGQTGNGWAVTEQGWKIEGKRAAGK